MRKKHFYLISPLSFFNLSNSFWIALNAVSACPNSINVVYSHTKSSAFFSGTVYSHSESSAISTDTVYSRSESSAFFSGTVYSHSESSAFSTENGYSHTKSSIHFFPNPANDYIEYTINDSTLNINELQLTIVAVSGATVIQKTITNTTGKIDITNLASGVYILSLSSDKQVKYRKKWVCGKD